MSWLLLLTPSSSHALLNSWHFIFLPLIPLCPSLIRLSTFDLFSMNIEQCPPSDPSENPFIFVSLTCIRHSKLNSKTKSKTFNYDNLRNALWRSLSLIEPESLFRQFLLFILFFSQFTSIWLSWYCLSSIVFGFESIWIASSWTTRMEWNVEVSRTAGRIIETTNGRHTHTRIQK